MGVSSAQRAPTASSYVFPALRGLAAITASSNHGCFSMRETKRCPTMPVPPMTPALNLLMMTSLSAYDYIYSYGSKIIPGNPILEICRFFLYNDRNGWKMQLTAHLLIDSHNITLIVRRQQIL
jgi:hypothetical protein